MTMMKSTAKKILKEDDDEAIQKAKSILFPYYVSYNTLFVKLIVATDATTTFPASTIFKVYLCKSWFGSVCSLVI